MYKIEIPRKLTVGVTPHRWGVYHHIRVGQYWWGHLKWGFWVQRGLRVSTRYQGKKGKKARYVTALRFNCSAWSSTRGRQGKPYVFGGMIYVGGGHRPHDRVVERNG